MLKAYLRLLLHTFKNIFLILGGVAFGFMVINNGPSTIELVGNSAQNSLLHSREYKGDLAQSRIVEETPLIQARHNEESPKEQKEQNMAATVKEMPRHQTDKEPDAGYFLNLLKEKMALLRESGYLQTIPETAVCGPDEEVNGRCKDLQCKSPPTPTLSPINIEQIRKPVRMVGGTEKLWKNTKKFKINPEKKKYVFITGASSKHFHQSEAAIQSLYSTVLPHLTNYSLVYYDLGLKAEERAAVKNFTGIELKDFPFDKFSPTFKYLKGFTWKPLIVLSHLNSAEFLIWMDSSINFTRDARPYFDTVLKTGILLNRNRYAYAQHVYAKMFSYFGEEACNFAEYGEFEGGFLVLHNEPFIRHLVLEPWSACALDENCMCPEETKSMQSCNHTIWQYSKCHRFDQSAIGLILIKLFRENVESVRVKHKLHAVKRGQYGTFLTEKYVAK